MLGLGTLLVGCGGSGSSGGVTSGDDPVSLLEVQAQVFTPSCALTNCHTQPDPPHGLDLSSTASSATSLVGVQSFGVPAQLRVERFNSAESYLVWKITADSRIEGDPMPAFGGTLRSADVTLIETWIDQGAN